MANIEGMYDDEAEPQSRDALPDHECTAQIKASEVKTTKAGTGQFIALTLELLDGPHKGRQVWDNINIKNPDKTCQDIGNATLAAIRIAAFGTKKKIADTAELHGIPMRIKIGSVKRKDNGEMSNVIKKYSNLTAAPSTGGGASVPSWNKPAGKGVDV